MNLILRPSLEHIALVKATTTMWNQPDIRALLEEFSNSQLDVCLESQYLILPLEDTESWRMTEMAVIDKVPQLAIPTSLKEKMSGYIKPVGIHILRWMEYHRLCCCLDLDLPSEFHWTPQGIVDKKKTAEAMIKDESIAVIIRFKLACIYCLEEDIINLWNKIPKGLKVSFFYDLEKKSRSYLQIDLLLFWKDYIKTKATRMSRVTRKSLNCNRFSDEQMLHFAANSGNKVAVEYFFQRLTPRTEILVKIASFMVEKRSECVSTKYDPSIEYCDEVFCFLLLQLNKAEQLEVFKSCPYHVLNIFLEWPWQSLFIETASLLWNFLSDRHYSLLLRRIIGKISTGLKDYDYRKILHEFLMQILPAHKNYAIKDFDIVDLVDMLLHIDDMQSIKLIFQNVSLMERNKLIFRDVGKNICECMINYKWDLFKFFVELCISSENEMIKFIQEFKRHIQTPPLYSRHKTERNENKLNEVFGLLDDFIQGYQKRKSGDESDSNPTKKLCN